MPIRGGYNPLSQAELAAVLPIMEESLAFKPLRPTTAFTFYFTNQAAITVDQLKAEAEKSSLATEHQLRDDARLLDDHNVAVRSGNDRVAGVLNDATGLSLPGDRRAWATWWVDRIGYASSSSDWTAKDSKVEDVSIAYQPPALPDGAAAESGRHRLRPPELLRRRDPGPDRVHGPRPIEQIRVGDRVLTQNVGDGALGYRPVLAVHHNPPSPTFRVKLSGEPIVSSPFPSILGRRPGLGDGPRPQGRRRDPDPRRRGEGRVERARLEPSRSSTSTWPTTPISSPDPPPPSSTTTRFPTPGSSPSTGLRAAEPPWVESATIRSIPKKATTAYQTPARTSAQSAEVRACKRPDQDSPRWRAPTLPDLGRGSGHGGG